MNFKVDISVCRVCMKPENGISLLKDRGLHEKFVYTTKLKSRLPQIIVPHHRDSYVQKQKTKCVEIVNDEDSMPSIICRKCIERLKVAYDFCRLANSSEWHLRKFLSKITTDFQEVTKTIPLDEENCAFIDEDDVSEAQALIEEAGGFDQIGDHPRHSKSESIAEELEVVEIQEDGATKNEVFEHEIYMEEFHEIIQEDNSDTQLYLDENSAEELHLYEDGDEMFDEERKEETESNVPDQQEVMSSAEAIEDKYTIRAVKKSPKKRTSRSAKKTHGETAAIKLEGKSNICIKCNKDFSTKTNLMRHMSTHDGVRPYQCNVCGKGFTQNGSLKQHMFIHTGERPHVCQVCERGFTQSKSLIFHMRRHTGEKPFTCDECGISFRQKDGLKHHVQKYHSGAPTTPERHVCCVCDRILSSKYSLSVHMRKHVNKSEGATDVVSEKKPDLDFDSEAAVANSKEVLSRSSPAPESETDPHPGSSPDPVPKQEIRRTHLRPLAASAAAGQRMKQFQCGKCFKSFHIKRNLLRHLRNHDVTSLELHECDECKIGFDTKRSLKLHRQRDHNDFVSDLNNCEYCNAPYATVADLSEHIANVHDAIEQNCPHCSEQFRSQKLYYDHLLEHEHMLED